MMKRLSGWNARLMWLSLVLTVWPSTLSLAHESTKSDSSRAVPRRRIIAHRSTGEEVAAFPGMLVYLPIHGAFLALEYGVSAIWEDRIFDRYKAWLTTTDGRAGVRPLANSTSGAGIRFFHRDMMLKGDARLLARWGGWPRQDYLFTLSWPDGRLVPGSLTFAGQYRNRPKELFYGIGPNVLKSSANDFLQEDILVQFIYRQRSSRVVAVGVDANYHSVDIRSGQNPALPNTDSLFTEKTLTGLANRGDFAEGAVFLRVQFLDHPGYPTRGNLSFFRLGYNRSVDDDAFSNLRLTAISEQFLELFYDRVVSLRLGTDWTVPVGDSGVPFYGLASIGGEELLRGFPRGRFRDRGVVFATATYKFPIWRVLNGFIFYETGRPFHHPRDFSFRDWKDSLGGGLRVWDQNGPVFEVLVARSSEQLRLIFNFNTGF